MEYKIHLLQEKTINENYRTKFEYSNMDDFI